MNTIGKIIAALTISAFVATPAWSAEKRPSFVNYDFYPFGHQKDGNVSGLFADLMGEIEKLSGIEVSKILEPIPRALQSMSRGKFDLILSGTSSPALKDTISLGILSCHRTNLVTHKKANITSLNDLKGKHIGFIASGFLFKKFGDKHGVVSMETGTSESMFLMLVRNRVGGIYISDIVFDSYRAEGLPFTRVPKDWREQIGPIIEAEVLPVQLRMHKQSEFLHLAPDLSKAITQGKINSAFEKVYQKYGSTTGGHC